jgi:hypothetical protein
MDLIRNLQEYLDKHDFDTKHRLREQALLEEKRLALLRRERSEYLKLGRNTGYCELYSTCADQLKFVQANCQHQSNQEASNFFKKKYGSCNARLFTLYQVSSIVHLKYSDK